MEMRRMKEPDLVDVLTYGRINAVLTGARFRGLSPIEELNRAGFLLTPAKDKKIRLETIEALVKDLERWRPVEFLRRRLRHGEAGTPADMYVAILGYLEEYLSVMRQQ